MNRRRQRWVKAQLQQVLGKEPSKSQLRRARKLYYQSRRQPRRGRKR